MKIKVVKFKELLNYSVIESHEKLIDVASFDCRIQKIFLDDVLLDLGRTKKSFFCRESVARKLANVNKKLKSINENYTLLIYECYRSLLWQEKRFNERVEFLKKDSETCKLSKDDFLEKVHQGIALPDLAGHPTGGAVDITIFDTFNNKELDMATKVADSNNDGKMSRFYIGNNQQNENRKLLLSLMVSEKFAPYWGEWWHYSYGDIEWAAYYNEKNAIYGKIADEFL